MISYLSQILVPNFILKISSSVYRSREKYQTNWSHFCLLNSFPISRLSKIRTDNILIKILKERFVRKDSNEGEQERKVEAFSAMSWDQRSS